MCPVELPERFPPLWEVAPSVVGRCRPAFSEHRLKPVLLPGSFCVPLRHRLSDLSQNYFFISKIENYRKSFIHADLPLFCTFPKFFPKSKIGRQILPQIFQNEFFQYRPILAVKFLTASRVCVAKVGAGIKKEPPLREALGEISFAVMFLHKESFGSSTSLMPYK